MTAYLCDLPYERPDHTIVRCTFLTGHPNAGDRCSWFAVKHQDEVDRDKIDYTPSVIQSLLDAMAEGALDQYIEAILAVGHARKRTRRGVRHEFRLSPEVPDG